MPVTYSRIDHMLALGVRATRTSIPAYPGGGGLCLPRDNLFGPCCLPVMSAGDYLGISQPAAVGLPTRLIARLVALPAAILWAPLLCLGVIGPSCLGCHHHRRARWCLAEWGSDHLPVLCALRPF